jgi:hypothetical protein
VTSFVLLQSTALQQQEVVMLIKALSVGVLALGMFLVVKLSGPVKLWNAGKLVSIILMLLAFVFMGWIVVTSSPRTSVFGGTALTLTV